MPPERLACRGALKFSSGYDAVAVVVARAGRGSSVGLRQRVHHGLVEGDGLFLRDELRRRAAMERGRLQ